MRLARPPRFAIAFALLLVASGARASSDYPAIVQSRLGLSRLPDCTLCHSDQNGGTGTVVTWFGLSLQDDGLKGQEPDLLVAALDQLEKDEVDSDGDGTPDVEELRIGGDPNDGAGPTSGPERPGRGCAISRAKSEGGGAVAMVALAIALAERMRRRARRLGPAG